MFRVNARSIAGPVDEAISLAEARVWLRIDVPGFSGDTGQDSLIASLIRAARHSVELAIDKAIGAQTILASARSFSPLYGWDADYLPPPYFGSGYGGSPDLTSPYYGRPLPAPLKLPLGPLRSIDQIRYRDATSGQFVVLDPATYLPDASTFLGGPVLAPGMFWPATAIGEDSVLITYTAGLALPLESASNFERLGEDVVQAMRLLVGHFYQNRSAVIVSTTGRTAALELPLGVQALLWPNRNSIGI